MISKQKNKAGLIVKGIRSFLNLSQHDIADITDTSQSTISKIESGKLEFSAFEWILFCQHFFINADCLTTGYVKLDLLKLSKIYPDLKANTLKNAEFKIEVLAPLINYVRSSIAESSFQELLNEIKVEEYFFSVLNNKLSLENSKDVLLWALEKIEMTRGPV